MNSEEQSRIIESQVSALRERLLRDILYMPEEWGTLEITWYMERVANNMGMSHRKFPEEFEKFFNDVTVSGGLV